RGGPGGAQAADDPSAVAGLPLPGDRVETPAALVARSPHSAGLRTGLLRRGSAQSSPEAGQEDCVPAVPRLSRGPTNVDRPDAAPGPLASRINRRAGVGGSAPPSRGPIAAAPHVHGNLMTRYA